MDQEKEYGTTGQPLGDELSGEDLSRGPTPETRHPDAGETGGDDDVRDTTQGPTPGTRRVMRATEDDPAAAGQPDADLRTRADVGGNQDLGDDPATGTKGGERPAIERQLISYIADAVAMEKNVDQMLAGMISTTDDALMRSRLKAHREETRHQRERLEGRLEAYGESSSALKDTLAKGGAMLKGMLDVARSDKAARNARDGYTTEHLEIAAYQLLERVARRAGDEDTAHVARANRAEEEAMARFLDRQWDTVADRALQEAGVS
jgi:ferritin-like metal-binding protein YciE